ncbi:TPA: sulfite exporter TauE/SafE family protein [Citrobacter farmeri]|uniref:sulfite exporter TauE/SafE family protein n=1 Tax=Citrobacter farmeri TaxID=67824 RepID=UPI0018974662|nr:sulfite exporter TauE/SafE family protein [Citrobacter farmeri]MBU5646938.1 sulfite exporter TauE/SafE family protein [Pluralibacter sp. S54_ASV_43]HAT3753485.1 sulfite exporter TauE/SafE family protein [Citrobacter amalonaticus]HAU5703442.1 sulfite exporter TauE/SafE family protein [Citrobacter freundii]EKU0079143.1 sulfite exporter TauE/SafE family protein [Citrobacter farmeri]MBJ9136873.1 sulfite exporter TauE/SafE family protein [Citrobacter farmeri]
MTLLFAFEPDQIVMIAMTFVLAGMVKGVTGMGLPTVAMGILGSLISPVAAAALLLLPSLVSNLFQFGGGGNTRTLLKRLWPMLFTVVIATLLASVWITGGDTSRTQFALGLALMMYALWTLAGKRIAVSPQREKPVSLVVGFATGLLTGGTGVFVMPAVPWIQSLGFGKDELVQALGISFTFSTLALALGLWWHGALPVQSMGLSAFAIIPALIGQWAGTRIRQRISPVVFKRCFLFCLMGLSVEMMLRATSSVL